MTLIWIMMVFSTLVVVHSPPAGHSYYWNKKWVDCPLTCETCTSNTTCTLCKTKYYGPACQLECHCNDDGCNKVTGVCAPGCVYGRWGNDCEFQCPGCGRCKTCDRNTGQCLQCYDKYFLHDGKCKICPRGCSLCVNDSKCTECQESYFLLDGRCESCMQGCRLCNTSNNCILCYNESITLFDGSCLVRCPANTTITDKLDNSTNLPGTHDNISTCEEHSYSYNYTESGFCQSQSKDLTNLEFKCIYHCNKSYDSISCERTFIVHERKQQHDISWNQEKDASSVTTDKEGTIFYLQYICICITIFLVIFVCQKPLNRLMPFIIRRIYGIWPKRQIPNEVNLPRQFSNEERIEIPPSVPIQCVDNLPKPVEVQIDESDEDSDTDNQHLGVTGRDHFCPSDDDTDTNEERNLHSRVEMCDE